VIVSVQDTGIGIPADDLPRIFERFYKADRARAAAARVWTVDRPAHHPGHGGRIWAESVEGQGSTFHFALPIAKETITNS